jgi:nicotinamidase-related amidase
MPKKQSPPLKGHYVDNFNPESPIQPQSTEDGLDFNVGQQFIDRVTPLMNKMRQRPIPVSVSEDVHPGRDGWLNPRRGYAVRISKAVGQDWMEGAPGYGEAQLWHNNHVVGTTSWDARDGHTFGLRVDVKHRHMTAKLLQEAWDHSRRFGGHGPATSDELNERSGPIVAKYNPESEAFQRSDWHLDGGHYSAQYDERQGDEDDAVNNFWAENRPCSTCRGHGGSRLMVLPSRYGNELSWTEVGAAEHWATSALGHTVHVSIIRHPQSGNREPLDYRPQDDGYVLNERGDTATKNCLECNGNGVVPRVT